MRFALRLIESRIDTSISLQSPHPESSGKLFSKARDDSEEIFGLQQDIPELSILECPAPLTQKKLGATENNPDTEKSEARVHAIQLCLAGFILAPRITSARQAVN